MKFPSITSIFQAVQRVARRFPIPVLVSLVATTSMLAFIHHLDGPKEDTMSWLLKIWMVGQIGLSLTLGVSLFGEATQLRPAVKLGSFALALGLLGWYYYTAYHWEDLGEKQMIQYVGLVLSAHLWVSFAPYLNRFSVQHFWEYNKQLLSVFVTGMFYSLVLWLGLSAGILATVELFQLDISVRTYAYLFVFLTGVVNTFFFLNYVPERFELEPEVISDKGVELFCKYFLIPITSLYFLILYAFSAKILFTWTLPRGWVSALVIGFASLGIFTWLLNYKLGRTSTKGIFQPYARWFWPVMLPMIVLLFVGLGRRISDYGFTPPLVIGVGVGIWLTLTALYFVISRTDNIKFVPASLLLFVLLSLYGPLSMFSISQRSQEAELAELLAPSGRWKAGQALPSDSLVSAEVHNRAYSILQFLTKYRDFKSEKPSWLAQMPDSLLVGKDRYMPEQILNWMQLKVQEGEDENRNSVLRVENPVADLQIPAGFSSFFEVNLVRGEQELENIDSSEVQLRFKIDSSGSGLLLVQYLGGQENQVERWDFQTLLQGWDSDKEKGKLDPNTMVLVLGDNFDACLVPREIWFGKESGVLQLEQVSGFVFLRKK